MQPKLSAFSFQLSALLLALLLTGCATTERKGSIQTPPVEYVK